MTLPLIVGVDGSDASLGAADWAGREAAATGRDVRLLYVRPTDFWTRPGDERLIESEAQALHAMSRLATELREAHPGLRVYVEAVTGDPDLTLLRTADQAGTLVLGTRGSGGFAALMLGSVAQSVAARAESPVLLVPPQAAGARPGYRVVAGVEPRGDCRPVLDFALRCAQDHGVVMRAVHAWQPPALWGAGPVQPGEVERPSVQHEHEQPSRCARPWPRRTCATRQSRRPARRCPARPPGCWSRRPRKPHCWSSAAAGTARSRRSDRSCTRSSTMPAALSPSYRTGDGPRGRSEHVRRSLRRARP